MSMQEIPLTLRESAPVNDTESRSRGNEFWGSQDGDSRANIFEKSEQMRKKREIDQRMRDLISSAGKRYIDCQFANFSTEKRPKSSEIVDACRNYAETINDRIRDGEGMVLYGPVGTGKDHLAFSVCRQAIIQSERTVKWISGQDFFGEVRDAMETNEREDDLIRKYSSSDILVISDPLPPFGNLTQFQASMLYRLVGACYERRQVMIATVNVASDEEADARLGAPVWDRLNDNAWKMHCNWASARQPKKWIK